MTYTHHASTRLDSNSIESVLLLGSNILKHRTRCFFLSFPWNSILISCSPSSSSSKSAITNTPFCVYVFYIFFVVSLLALLSLALFCVEEKLFSFLLHLQELLFSLSGIQFISSIEFLSLAAAAPCLFILYTRTSQPAAVDECGEVEASSRSSQRNWKK